MPAPCDLVVKRRELECFRLKNIVLSDKVVRRRGRLLIAGRCGICGVQKDYHVDNIQSGKTQGCACSKNRNYEGNPLAEIFGDRFDALKQRCENASSQSFKDYGGRGICNRFASREACIRYLLALVASDYPWIMTAEQLRPYEIDRIDNDGDYEEGNLRLVSSRKNLSNPVALD